MLFYKLYTSIVYIYLHIHRHAHPDIQIVDCFDIKPPPEPMWRHRGASPATFASVLAPELITAGRSCALVDLVGDGSMGMVNLPITRVFSRGL